MRYILKLAAVFATHYALLAPSFSATPIVDAKLSGANNELKAGSTLTINGTLTLGSGGSITGTQPLDAALTSLSGLSSAANKLAYFSDSDTFALTDITALSRTMLAYNDTSAWRTAILPPGAAAGDFLYYNGSAWTSQSLGSLSGLAKISSGVFSAATAGTDYVAPGSIGASGLTMSSGVLIGRSTAGIGAIETISIGDGLVLSDGTLSASGSGTVSGPSSSVAGHIVTFGDATGGALADPSSISLSTDTFTGSGAIKLFPASGSAVYASAGAEFRSVSKSGDSSESLHAVFKDSSGNRIFAIRSQYGGIGARFYDSSNTRYRMDSGLAPDGTLGEYAYFNPYDDSGGASVPFRIAARAFYVATAASGDPQGSHRLSVSETGAIRFNSYPAGTLVTDSSGNITTSSDARLKHVDGPFARGLADVVKLEPVLYHWLGSSGLDTTTQYAGFVAQDVRVAIPEAITEGKDGILALQDRPIIAAVVNSVKELDQRSAILEIMVSGLTAILVLVVAWNIVLVRRAHG